MKLAHNWFKESLYQISRKTNNLGNHPKNGNKKISIRKPIRDQRKKVHLTQVMTIFDPCQLVIITFIGNNGQLSRSGRFVICNC